MKNKYHSDVIKDAYRLFYGIKMVYHQKTISYKKIYRTA